MTMRSIVIETAPSVELNPAPISPDWILAGTPEARSKMLAKSHDRTSSIMVWECTAGRFNWHYSEDETVVIISGEVFITTEKGEERRLRPRRYGIFPRWQFLHMAYQRSRQKGCRPAKGLAASAGFWRASLA